MELNDRIPLAESLEMDKRSVLANEFYDVTGAEAAPFVSDEASWYAFDYLEFGELVPLVQAHYGVTLRESDLQLPFWQLLDHLQESRASDNRIATLPAEVRAAALVQSSGEVAWRPADAARAIDELAKSGSRILGLDLWMSETGPEIPWRSFDNGDIDQSRLAAHAALAELEHSREITMRDVFAVLVTWE